MNRFNGQNESPLEMHAGQLVDQLVDQLIDPQADPLPALAQRMQCHRAPFDGGTVAWRCMGQGSPLVLLHGGHGSWGHWARNIEHLAQQHRVWVPDMPGYGDSAAPAAPAALTLASLLQALLASLNALLGAQTPIGLAGFSFGGLVAAHLAHQRGKVTRLALLGPAGHGGKRRPRGPLQAWRDAYERRDAPALAAVMRHNLAMHMLAADAASVDAAAVAIHTRLCLRTRFVSRRLSQAGGLQAALAPLACPVLFLWGEHDVTATPLHQAGELAAACQHGQTHTVPGVGHWVQYEAASVVNSQLAHWFAPIA